ncbi:hypothetical protein [Magnetovibrio sp.]|uniref:hypothetical protein n=1 Tax=Magnetovibrio sp. TaxID=2024836 RepID=UPI002F937F3D
MGNDHNPKAVMRRVVIVASCVFVLGGCSLAKNTIEAPFVALDHVFSGQSNRDKIRELSKSNRDLSRANDSLAEEIGVLRKQNLSLKEKGKAFEALVSVFDTNPCFHVHRQGEFQVLIQPRMDERCME